MSASKGKYPPREGDLPKKELVELANTTILQNGGPSACSVYFKFTCCHCGSRCTLVEPNTLHDFGECAKCGNTTEIEKGGLTVSLAVHHPQRN